MTDRKSPPVLSPESRKLAFQKSLELRQDRKLVKAMLNGNAMAIGFAWSLDVAKGMKVIDLLMALPAIGKTKAERLLEEAGIPIKNTVRACGPRQTERLFALLKEKTPAS